MLFDQLLVVFSLCNICIVSSSVSTFNFESILVPNEAFKSGTTVQLNTPSLTMCSILALKEHFAFKFNSSSGSCQPGNVTHVHIECKDKPLNNDTIRVWVEINTLSNLDKECQCPCKLPK